MTRQEFDLRVRALFDSKHPDALSIFAFIQRTLGQFRLVQSYEVRDILVESYVRGAKFIEGNGEIQNPLAWIRSTAYNIIRERRREMDRINYKDLDAQPSLQPDSLSKIMMVNDVRAMRIAFQRLDADDRDILRLRIVDQMSWREVGKCLAAIEGTEFSSDDALRQKGYRALKKLRAIYDIEREQILLDDD